LPQRGGRHSGAPQIPVTPVKLLLDLLPVVVFFGVFRLAKWLPLASVALVSAWFGAIGGEPAQQAELAAVILASLSAIAATAIQVGWLLARRLPVKPAVWISAVLVVVFGGLTIWLHNEWFIKWKPSILYWSFGAILLGGKWIWNRNLLGSLLSQELELPAAAWDTLLFAWSVFFLVLGAANLYVAYAWSTESWVNFKTFGAMGLTLVFSIATGWYVTRNLPVPAPVANKPDGDG
jgi:intracellular septation protein